MSAAKHLTFWEALQTHPPAYVRVLAKRGQRTAISDAEIAISSGIEINRVREINYMMDWNAVTFQELMSYTMACNFDPTSAKDRERAKKYDYICRTRQAKPFQYLMVHPKWESEFLPLIRILKTQLQQQHSAA